MRRTLALFVVALELMYLAPVATANLAKRGAGIPPEVRRCASPRRATNLQPLLDQTRRALGQADEIKRVKIGTPPRFFVGRSYPPTHRKITLRSQWIYITVPSDRVRGDGGNVASQRGRWQAALLMQAFAAATCARGERPEVGDWVVDSRGKQLSSNAGGAVQSSPRSYGWPFARIGAAFATRLYELAHIYDFRVTSFRILHGIGDAPQIRVESEHPTSFIEHLPAIEAVLYPVVADCWAASSCLNGDFLEATDHHGDPFLATAGQSAIGTGVGGWGSQWVRSGLPYPFPHG